MALKRIKTEHSGLATGGAWMPRAQAKLYAKKKRRQEDRRLTHG